MRSEPDANKDWYPPVEPILVERIPLICLSVWFMDNKAIEKGVPRTPCYYETLQGKMNEKEIKFLWKGANDLPHLSKFDFAFTKYLLAGYFQSRKGTGDASIIYVDFEKLSDSLVWGEKRVRIKEQVENSLYKFKHSFFDLGIFDSIPQNLVTGYEEWFEDKDERQRGFIVRLKKSTFEKIVSPLGAKLSKKRTLYPIKIILSLYMKSKANNFLPIIDRIFALPLCYNRDAQKLVTATFEHPSYLTLQSGKRDILDDVHKIIQDPILIKRLVPVAKYRVAGSTENRDGKIRSEIIEDEESFSVEILGIHKSIPNKKAGSGFMYYYEFTFKFNPDIIPSYF